MVFAQSSVLSVFKKEQLTKDVKESITLASSVKTELWSS